MRTENGVSADTVVYFEAVPLGRPVMKFVGPVYVPLLTMSVSPLTIVLIPLAIVFHGFASVPVPVVSLPVVDTYLGDVDANEAITEQFPVIGFVTKDVPVNVPPQVPLMMAEYPPDGVTVNVLVAPFKTDCTVDGLIVPFAPADGVTEYELRVKLATTVQFTVTALVV